MPFGRKETIPLLGLYPSLARISKIVKISTQELDRGKQVENGVVGVPRKCLEAKARVLASQGKWAPFMDILELLIFADLVFAGERIEVGLKRGKFDCVSPIGASSRRTGIAGEKKKEEMPIPPLQHLHGSSHRKPPTVPTNMCNIT